MKTNFICLIIILISENLFASLDSVITNLQLRQEDIKIFLETYVYVINVTKLTMKNISSFTVRSMKILDQLS